MKAALFHFGAHWHPQRAAPFLRVDMRGSKVTRWLSPLAHGGFRMIKSATERQGRLGWTGALAIGSWMGAGALLPSSAPLSAQQTQDAVTFTADVAPILQKRCVTCHRPGTAAPMALLTYEDAKRYAPRIRAKVSSREMPPWHVDKTVGIQAFKNDISLTPSEIETLVRWVDSGTLRGDPALMPPPIDWPAPGDHWEFEDDLGRPPDLVVSSPPYRVIANGRDQWPILETTVQTGLTGDRWIRAAELRPADPGTRAVFHHANPSMIQDGRRQPVGHSAVGTVGYIYPDDAGQLIKPGEATFEFNMHLYPRQEDTDAVLQLGLWFFPEDAPPPYETPGEVIFEASQSTGFGFDREMSPRSQALGATRGSGGGRGGVSTDPQFVRQADLLIPPNSMAMYRGVYVLDRPARIHSVRPHMHLRGKYQVIEAIYPDGRWEVLNKLDWDQGWQTAFLYEDYAMPLLPKGTVLLVTNVFDNTSANPKNPDPTVWVARGDRTIDEMSHTRLGITYFDREEDFERLVQERERVLAEMAQHPVAP